MRKKAGISFIFDSLRFPKELLLLVFQSFTIASDPKTFKIVYLPAFLDTGLTGLPRGNVHERDAGPMQGTLPTQSHNP